MMGLSNITVLYAFLAVTSLCSGVSSTSLNDNSSAVDQRYTKPLGVNKGFEALTNISSNRIINGDENDADEDDGNNSGDGDTDDGSDNDGDEDDDGSNSSPTSAPTNKVTEAIVTPAPTGTNATSAPTAAKPAPPAPAPTPTPDSSDESNTYRRVLSSILLTVWCIVLIIFFWTLRAEIPAFCIKIWMHLRTNGIKGCCSCFRRGGSNSSDGGNLNDIIFDPEEEQRNSLSQQLLADE